VIAQDAWLALELLVMSALSAGTGFDAFHHH
jgi:hypothetical protein